MRLIKNCVGAVGLALLAAACGVDGQAVTAPSALLGSGVRGTAANGGATLVRLTAALVVDPATCALVPPGTGVISGGGDFLFVLRGDVVTPSGFTVSGRGEATDGNGERWHWNDADLFFSMNARGNALEQTITEGFHLIGPRGAKIMVRGTFHVTYVNGALIVEIENGNHEANELCEGFIF